MDYIIEFAILCDKGKVRKTNQDNFWHAGRFLDAQSDGLSTPFINTAAQVKNPVFAVFDGLGGERHGDIAAYLAAKTLDSFDTVTSKDDLDAFLSSYCTAANKEICTYAKSKFVNGMGTTAVLLAFGAGDVYICNIGDSRAFLYNEAGLVQISEDHVMSLPTAKKPTLSQYLGIFEKEFVIEPYIARGGYNENDRYLICTDGLTDMVTEQEIADILCKEESVASAADALMHKAMANGGTDNITLIVCEVKK
jgi:protein phosphatase